MNSILSVSFSEELSLKMTPESASERREKTSILESWITGPRRHPLKITEKNKYNDQNCCFHYTLPQITKNQFINITKTARRYIRFICLITDVRYVLFSLPAAWSAVRARAAWWRASAAFYYRAQGEEQCRNNRGNYYVIENSHHPAIRLPSLKTTKAQIMPPYTGGLLLPLFEALS